MATLQPPVSSFTVPSGDPLLSIPADAAAGVPVTRPLEFHDAGETDVSNVGLAPCARPIGADIACGKDFKQAILDAKAAVGDEAWRKEVVNKHGGGNATLDRVFREILKDYEPVDTDQEYYRKVTLAVTDGKRLGAVSAACAACAAERAPPPRAEEKRKKASGADVEKRKKKAADAGVGSLKVPRADGHTCLVDRVTRKDQKRSETKYTGPQRLEVRFDEKRTVTTIFQVNGVRNNIVQLMRLAADIEIYPWHLQTMVLSIAIHAWATINGRWMRYAPREDFSAAQPPWLMQLFRVRDFPPAERLKDYEALLDSYTDQIDLAKKLPLSIFLVAVCESVQALLTQHPEILTVPSHAKDTLLDKPGELFETKRPKLAKFIDQQVSKILTAFLLNRIGWVFMATSDLTRQWPAGEEAAAGERASRQHRRAVSVAEYLPNFKVRPPGLGTQLIKYARRGGYTFESISEDRKAYGDGWFRTAYLPVYAAHLYLDPGLPPLHTDQYYYASSHRRGYSLTDLERWHVYLNCFGKYGPTLRAKEKKMSVLSDRLNPAARPDTLHPVRFRFAHVHSRSDDADEHPRLIRMPPLIRLPWQDPNEASPEHLLPEYVEYCQRVFNAEAVDAEVKRTPLQQHLCDLGHARQFVDDLSAAVGIRDEPGPEQDAWIGGRALVYKRHDLLRKYALFVNACAITGDLQQAIGSLRDEVTHAELVEASRYFRALALRRASALQTEHGLELKRQAVTKFVTGKCGLKSSMGALPYDASERVSQTYHSVGQARVLDLLVEILRNPGTPPDKVCVEGGEFTLARIRADYNDPTCTCAFLADRGAVYLPDLVPLLCEHYDRTLLVPGYALARHLTEARTFVYNQQRPSDPTPVKTDAHFGALQLYRSAIAHSGPAAVLAEMQALDGQDDHARFMASALKTTELKAFWERAERDGKSNEIKAVMQSIHKPPAATAAPAASETKKVELRVKWLARPLKAEEVDAFACDLYVSSLGQLSKSACIDQVKSWAPPPAISLVNLMGLGGTPSPAKTRPKLPMTLKRKPEDEPAGQPAAKRAAPAAKSKPMMRTVDDPFNSDEIETID